MSKNPPPLPGPFTSEFIPGTANAPKSIFPPEIPQVGQKIRIIWPDKMMFMESIVMTRYAIKCGNETDFHVHFFSHLEYPYLMYLDKKWILYRGDDEEHDNDEDLIVEVSIVD